MTLGCRGVAILALGALTTAAARGATPPPYATMRHEENYAFFAGAAASGWLDRLKAVPLSKTREGWFLTVGGSFRWRYERFENEDWDAANDADGSLLQRYLVLGDFHFGPRWRLFTHVMSALESGRDTGARPTDEDRLDVHEAFVDVTLDPKTKTLVRLGRQEMSFGSQRLVSVRKGPNVMRAFDGIAVEARFVSWRLDAFASRPVESDPGRFDDGSDSDRTFWGVYAVGPFGGVDGGHADLYYLGLDREDAAFDQGTAQEQRETIGTRIWGRGRLWDYNNELVVQWGRFGPAPIRAWTVATDTGRSFPDAAWRPRAGLKADVTSGDRDRTDPGLESFNPLFPRGSYFGENGMIGPINHVDLHPSVDLHPTENLTISPSWVFFWRQSLDDGVYDVGTNLVRSGAGSEARSVGNQPTLTVTWTPNRHTTLVVELERFQAGRFLSDTGPGDSVSFLACWVEVVF